MLSTRLPDKAYPTPYLLIMAHTLIYIVCIQQRSSLSLVESKLPLLADKDVSPSAHTELLRSASCGFASVETEQGDHGKGKFEIGRTQGLHRTCRVANIRAQLPLAPWHCSCPKLREHLLKFAFPFLPTKLPLFLLVFLCDWRNEEIHDHLLNLL